MRYTREQEIIKLGNHNFTSIHSHIITNVDEPKEDLVIDDDNLDLFINYISEFDTQRYLKFKG